MKLVTSESVSIGHPDKVCDQISDAILDECLKQDPSSRVAVETMATTDNVFLSGEVTTKVIVDFSSVARRVIEDIGYGYVNYELNGFDYHTVRITENIHKQSPDIAMGVDKDGAGDQGMMFGYAEGTEETNYMPLPIYYANRIMEECAKARKTDVWAISHLRPDAKCQLTFDMENEENPKLKVIVLSHQHTENVELEDLNDFVRRIANKCIPGKYFGRDFVYMDAKSKLDYSADCTYMYVNPTGRFVHGGPSADTGLTGRKIIVDTYGGFAHHGGGAFSGKDPSKVDRSAAYMCRYVAKNLVAKGLCKKAEVSVAYAIGVAEPVQISVDSFGTGNDDELVKYVKDNFDFRPRAIIEKLHLREPYGWSYEQTARNGHFGHNEFPWEQID